MRARNFARAHVWHDEWVTARGLRERKKAATRVALREAALRLALEHGPDNVRVEDIAEAAGVSPRTYNNYFSSREHAIVAAVTADRDSRVTAAITARPKGIRLAQVITDAIVAQYTDPGERHRDALLLITTHPSLRSAFLSGADAIAPALGDAIATRIGDSAGLTARVLAASVAAAVRIALEEWLQPAVGGSGLIVASGSLPDRLRTALAPLEPALDAAERKGR
ncbi:putative transcriptional regulator, TetR family [Nocardia nova SH22a]|uniref:Putative transcriptional regulator, TetR family n=1 Tax=Nocardia nova SH22a TaxID=1415166 RepID=W5TRW4_9NOCA|nr:TetR/AcrR family transcriptional regulator [Nocardia nova]AHH21874.1 putative transcriptional regulator, TetR family [Nocardia nova SH22a]